MAAVVKIKSQGQVHRVILSEGEPTHENVQEAIRKVYPEGTCTAKYLDDEGDLCTLCPASFDDFVSVSDGKTLKLEVFFVGPSHQAPAASIGPSIATTPPDVPKTASAAPFNAAAPEFVPSAPQAAPQAAPQGAAQREASAATSADNPLAGLLGGLLQGLQGNGDGFAAAAHAAHAAKPFFEALAGKAAAFGAGASRARRGHWWKGCGKGRHAWKPRKMLFLLAQLRKNGVLSAKSSAALALFSLPELLEHAAEHGETLNSLVQEKMAELRPVIEDLRSLVTDTPGLEACEPALANLLSQESALASEALPILFTALDDMTFKARASFLEAFFATQEERLEALFAEADERMPWMPHIPLEHEGITCDACARGPVKGLRFKCKTCPDCDLCAECFVDRDALHGGECSEHEFDMMSWPASCGPWQFMQGMGESMGKGMWNSMGNSMWTGKGQCGGEAAQAKGMGKGMWKGKGECWEQEAVEPDKAAEEAAKEADVAKEETLQTQAMQLQDMGLGRAEVLVELLRSNGGSMHKVIDALLEGR